MCAVFRFDGADLWQEGLLRHRYHEGTADPITGSTTITRPVHAATHPPHVVPYAHAATGSSPKRRRGRPTTTLEPIWSSPAGVSVS
jgi:hypothetical protein